MNPIHIDSLNHKSVKRLLLNLPSDWSVNYLSLNHYIKSGLLLGCVMLSACINQNNHSAPIESVQNDSKNPVNNEQSTLNNTSSQSFPLPTPPIIESTQTINLQNTNIQVDQSVEPANNGSIPVSSFSVNDPSPTTTNVGLPQTTAIQMQNASYTNGSYTIAANSPVTINTGTTAPLNVSADISPNIDSNSQSNNTNWQELTDEVVSLVFAEANISFTNQEILFVNNVSNQAISAMPVFVIDQLLNQRASAIVNAKIADQQAVLVAKQQLGIAANDTLLTRSKAIAIARQLNARYTLYPIVTGSSEAPILTVQLINASTAEIIAEANSK